MLAKPQEESSFLTDQVQPRDIRQRSISVENAIEKQQSISLQAAVQGLEKKSEEQQLPIKVRTLLISSRWRNTWTGKSRKSLNFSIVVRVRKSSGIMISWRKLS